MVVLYILGGLALFPIAYILFLAVCSLLVDPEKEYGSHSGFYRFLLVSASELALRILRVRVHVSGMDQIPADVMPLFVENHLSNYDPIVSWCVLKKWRPAFISKASNFKIPIFGRFIRKCCFMAIDRENPRNALNTIYKAAELLKRQEIAVAVYPEGTRSKTGELLPFHNGVFKIAKKAGAPIVVLQISGTEKIYRNIPFHHTDVYLSVASLICQDEVRSMRTDAIGERVRAALQGGQKGGVECFKRG